MKDSSHPDAMLEQGQHYLEKELLNLLQRDKLMFEFFQDDVVDGLWYWDLTDPENEWMSPKFWRLFGYDPEFKEHKITEWQDIIFPEDLAVAKRNLELHLKNPKHPYDQVVRYWHKNGTIVWVRCRGIAIYSNEGEPVRLLGCHLDMTRVMERQQELLGLQIKYEHLQRRLDEVHSELSQVKLLNDSLLRRSESERIRDDYGFAGSQFFIEHVRLLAQSADRLECKLTTLRFSFNGINGDITQSDELKNFLNKSVFALIPGCVPFQFSNELIGVVMLDYSEDDVRNIELEMRSAVQTHPWLAGKPVIGLQYRVLPVNSEMLDKYLDLSYILEMFFK